MSELVNLLSWLLLIGMWMWVLSVLVRPAPPRTTQAAPAGTAGRGARPVPASRPVPQPAAAPPAGAAPAAPPAPRRDVLLLGDSPGDLDAADAAARRHLNWVGRHLPQPVAASRAAQSDNAAVALGAARAAVLGSRRSGDVEAALRDCATVGVPLLLPARR